MVNSLSKKKQKLWTIIINCYNSTKTICHTLNSLNLENDDIVVFVIDDGSTDHLKQKINYFLKKYRQTIFYFHKKNSNWGGCINFIRNKINSKYVSILDSDDEYNTNSFNQIINIMKTIDATPDLLLVNYCLNFLDNGKIVKKRISKATEKIKFKIFTKIKLFSFITIHATIFRSEIFKKIKLLPCHVCYTDTLLIYYALQHVKVIGYIDKNIYLYNYFIRKGNQSISMERSINNFNHFTLILEHLLKNSLPQNSAKKRIIVQAKIIKYWIFWILEIISQSYNLPKDKKNQILKNCMEKLNNFVKNHQHYRFAFKNFIFKILNFFPSFFICFAKLITCFAKRSLLATTTYNPYTKKKIKLEIKIANKQYSLMQGKKKY